MARIAELFAINGFIFSDTIFISSIFFIFLPRTMHVPVYSFSLDTARRLMSSTHTAAAPVAAK